MRRSARFGTGRTARCSGSGLTHRFTDSRSVTISAPTPAARAGVPDGAIVLDTVTIQAGGGGTTEGSGSYASGMASMLRGAASLPDVPQSVTVITRQAIEDQNLTTLEQTLAKTPGVVANREAFSSPAFYAWGFKINNDQIDFIGTSYESAFRPDFDMAIYDRIKVLRGAEGLFSGSGEPGGGINLARKRATDTCQSSVTLSRGSGNNSRIEAGRGAARPRGRRMAGPRLFLCA